MKVELLQYPGGKEWMEVKRRALITVGKTKFNAPTDEWKANQMLRPRHSPIRYIMFSFYLEVPYWVSVHLVRHIHAQPYVKSQRNDRQSDYDRNTAPQNELVSMIWDMNAEELITICNKRLCRKASKETREVVQIMADLVVKKCPEFKSELVPMCKREGRCYEAKPCGFISAEKEFRPISKIVHCEVCDNAIFSDMKYCDRCGAIQRQEKALK